MSLRGGLWRGGCGDPDDESSSPSVGFVDSTIVLLSTGDSSFIFREDDLPSEAVISFWARREFAEMGREERKIFPAALHSFDRRIVGKSAYKSLSTSADEAHSDCMGKNTYIQWANMVDLFVGRIKFEYPDNLLFNKFV